MNQRYRQMLHDLAMDNHGVITTSQARQNGIPPVALRNIAAVDEDVWRIARGVYRVNDEDIDPILSDYAIGVAVGGPESFIWGHSVLALHDLACEMPRFVYVGNPRARQTRMSGFVRITRRNVPANQLTRYSGIPSTTVAQAFRDAYVDGDKLEDALEDALARKLITQREYDELWASLAG